MNTNPIDKDKITETPHILPYAHSVGGFPIKPVDKGKVKGRAMSAMMEQTEIQLKLIYKQIELLADQARTLQTRVELSEKIYAADMGFEPFCGHHYYLFERENGQFTLSMISPEEWRGKMPFKTFAAEVKLLSDHTWQIIRTNEHFHEF